MTITTGAERVRLAVNALTQSGAEFGGTADVLYYFPHLDRFVRFNNKICASSMFYTRDYARSHACLEGRRNGAEASFRNAKHVAVLANRQYLHRHRPPAAIPSASGWSRNCRRSHTTPPSFFRRIIWAFSRRFRAPQTGCGRPLGEGRPLTNPVWGRGGVGT